MFDVESSPISSENFVIAKRETNVARGEFVPLSSLNPDTKLEPLAQVPVKVKSIEEREEEYRKARARIFSEDADKKQSDSDPSRDDKDSTGLFELPTATRDSLSDLPHYSDEEEEYDADFDRTIPIVVPHNNYHQFGNSYMGPGMSPYYGIAWPVNGRQFAQTDEEWSPVPVNPLEMEDYNQQHYNSLLFNPLSVIGSQGNPLHASHVTSGSALSAGATPTGAIGASSANASYPFPQPQPQLNHLQILQQQQIQLQLMQQQQQLKQQQLRSERESLARAKEESGERLVDAYHRNYTPPTNASQHQQSPTSPFVSTQSLSGQSTPAHNDNNPSPIGGSANRGRKTPSASPNYNPASNATSASGKISPPSSFGSLQHPSQKRAGGFGGYYGEGSHYYQPQPQQLYNQQQSGLGRLNSYNPNYAFHGKQSPPRSPTASPSPPFAANFSSAVTPQASQQQSPALVASGNRLEPPFPVSHPSGSFAKAASESARANEAESSREDRAQSDLSATQSVPTHFESDAGIPITTPTNYADSASAQLQAPSSLASPFQSQPSTFLSGASFLAYVKDNATSPAAAFDGMPELNLSPTTSTNESTALNQIDAQLSLPSLDAANDGKFGATGSKARTGGKIQVSPTLQSQSPNASTQQQQPARPVSPPVQSTTSPQSQQKLFQLLTQQQNEMQQQQQQQQAQFQQQQQFSTHYNNKSHPGRGQRGGHYNQHNNYNQHANAAHPHNQPSPIGGGGNSQQSPTTSNQSYHQQQHQSHPKHKQHFSNANSKQMQYQPKSNNNSPSTYSNFASNQQQRTQSASPSLASFPPLPTPSGRDDTHPQNAGTGSNNAPHLNYSTKNSLSNENTILQPQLTQSNSPSIAHSTNQSGNRSNNNQYNSQNSQSSHLYKNHPRGKGGKRNNYDNSKANPGPGYANKPGRNNMNYQMQQQNVVL